MDILSYILSLLNDIMDYYLMNLSRLVLAAPCSTFFLKDKESSIEVMNIFDIFSSFTSLKPNKSKWSRWNWFTKSG